MLNQFWTQLILNEYIYLGPLYMWIIFEMKYGLKWYVKLVEQYGHHNEDSGYITP